MSSYFDEEDKFDHHLFMSDLLEGMDTAVQNLFGERTYIKNKGHLSRVTPNMTYSHKCYNCTLENENYTLKKSPLYRQCKSCKVTTCQTKMGVCIQLKWQKCLDLFNIINMESCYCSIDLVPAMFIEKLMTELLQRFTNSNMLSPGHPACWFDHLKNFVKEDKILKGAEDFPEIDRVLLKTYSCGTHNGYFIRAGPLLGLLKFKTVRLREAYCYIKALKKILGIDNVSMFMVKKLLMQEKFVKMDTDNPTIQELVRKILLTHELRINKFDQKIYFEKWSRDSSDIPIKSMSSKESLRDLIWYDYCVPLMGPDLFNGNSKKSLIFLLILSFACSLVSLGEVITNAISISCWGETQCILNDNVVSGLEFVFEVIWVVCVILLISLAILSKHGKFRSISLFIIMLVIFVAFFLVMVGGKMKGKTYDPGNIILADIIFLLLFVFTLFVLFLANRSGQTCSISFCIFILLFSLTLASSVLLFIVVGQSDGTDALLGLVFRLLAMALIWLYFFFMCIRAVMVLMS